ncbi:type 2 periplasmic-binding domain-containing protein [Acetobacter fallax]|uniref:hypothetical protein n=1 Tax=Acetobacter fallax TaxID=1737473 RepID=UPI00156B5DB4|nr:hypothetical protein [Acetobacter fallax]
MKQPLRENRHTPLSRHATLHGTVAGLTGFATCRARAAGAIDAGETGDAPPVFARNLWADRLLYVGHGAPASQRKAILAHRKSPVTDMADLKSRSIAFNRGASVHYPVLAALARAGLLSSPVHVKDAEWTT